MNLSLLRLASTVIALTVTVVCTADQGPVYSVVVPASAAQAGTTIDVQIAALNPSANAMVVTTPRTLNAALMAGGKRFPVTLELRTSTTEGSQSIAPRNFTLQNYALIVPRDAPAGIAALEVQHADAGVVRTAIELSPQTLAVKSGGAVTQRPMTSFVHTQTAAESLRRIFADRLAPHESIYFIYGPDDPAAKFQFSFKYKLLEFSEVAPHRMARTLHFAYTQRSLWDIKEESSPFYDTSYMPELMYQSLAPMPEKDSGFTWLGFQAAFKHESNGRAGAQSRSVNIVYGRTVFAFGHLNGWHLLAIPEVFGYVSSVDENSDIADYRGYGKLSVIIGRNDGPSLTTLLWAGKDFDHVSTQLDFTLPVRTKLLNFETYFLVQYFNGYGESLLSYNTHSETIRAGISLVR
jgi:phospholipase A1/A2